MLGSLHKNRCNVCMLMPQRLQNSFFVMQFSERYWSTRYVLYLTIGFSIFYAFVRRSIASNILDVNNIRQNSHYNTIMERKFAQKLKELRTEANLSLEKLGKLVGISSSALCNWENNISDISSDNLIALAKFFGVTTDYLLGLED